MLLRESALFVASFITAMKVPEAAIAREVQLGTNKVAKTTINAHGLHILEIIKIVPFPYCLLKSIGGGDDSQVSPDLRSQRFAGHLVYNRRYRNCGSNGSSANRPNCYLNSTIFCWNSRASGHVGQSHPLGVNKPPVLAPVD
jgi:hypothetical protein